MSKHLVFFLLQVLSMGLYAFDSADAGTSIDEILRCLQDADRSRQAAFAGYSGSRHYVIENSRFHVRATMKVQVQAPPNGSKRFQIVEITGPPAIRKMVFQRMLDTEAAASAASSQESTRISQVNYSFRLVGNVTQNGKSYFVLEVEPRKPGALLFRGKVWVDVTELAIVRIEGSPSQSPSFWVKQTQFIHEYQRIGHQWLAATNQSTSDVRVFGQTAIRIDYSDYTLTEPDVRHEAVERSDACQRS